MPSSALGTNGLSLTAHPSARRLRQSRASSSSSSAFPPPPPPPPPPSPRLRRRRRRRACTAGGAFPRPPPPRRSPIPRRRRDGRRPASAVARSDGAQLSPVSRSFKLRTELRHAISPLSVTVCHATYRYGSVTLRHGSATCYSVCVSFLSSTLTAADLILKFSAGITFN